jgi:hypothetical protein
VQKRGVHLKVIFERVATLSVMYRQNGKQLCSAQSATTFTNLISPRRGFVNTRTTVAAGMGNVIIAMKQRTGFFDSGKILRTSLA